MDDQVRAARKTLTTYYACGDDVWLPLIEDKKSSVDLDTIDGVLSVLSVYKLADGDYLSIPLLRQHINFLIDRHSHFSSSDVNLLFPEDPFSVEWTREALGAVVVQGVGHFTQVGFAVYWQGVTSLVSRAVATYGTQFESHAFKFFASYSNFTLNRNAPPTREFRRLKRLKGWKDDDKEYAKARERFADALAEDFNVKYGADVNNIDHWHAMCRICRVDPVPKGISACRKAVKSRFVNLVDLVYHTDKVRPFPSLEALAKYSKRRVKFYPRESAKAGGILRYLLRHIES